MQDKVKKEITSLPLDFFFLMHLKQIKGGNIFTENENFFSPQMYFTMKNNFNKKKHQSLVDLFLNKFDLKLLSKCHLSGLSDHWSC